MIRSAGLLVPLIVKWSGSKTGYIVVDGNRRLAAIRSLSEWTAPVPCVVLDGSFDENNKAKSDAAIAQAREVALMTAVGRLPMHPVDQFETFQALIAGGYRPDDIIPVFHWRLSLTRLIWRLRVRPRLHSRCMARRRDRRRHREGVHARKGHRPAGKAL